MPRPLLPDWPALNPGEVLAKLGGIYEHSQWVAEQLLGEGLRSADREPTHLAARIRAIVDAAGPEAHLKLLRAHPELAGKLAVARKLEAHSTAEQASAGLDQCTAEEFESFQRLNSAYTEKFGHPFIIAVRGLSRAEILRQFQRRLDNPTGTEFATALAEVHKIARLRLLALATES